MVDSTPERNIQSGTLAKIEERYRVLFHSAVYGIVHLHRSGRVLMMNRAAEEIMGRGPDDFSEPLEHAEPSSAIREDGTPLPGIDYPARVALTSGREVHGVVLGIYNRRDRAWRRRKQLRRQPQAFDQLAHTEHCDDADDVLPVPELDQCRRATEDDHRRRAEIGHERQYAGDHADQDADVQADRR